MKRQTVVYWICTGWVACVMTISGALALFQHPQMMKALARLGYPAYFSGLLGLAKLAGTTVLLLPKMPRLKEWAYAGFGIVTISAAYSHWRAGDGWMALDPLVTLAAIAVSYAMRTEEKQWFATQK